MKNLTQEAKRALAARVTRVRVDGTPQQAFERLMRRHRAVGAAMSILHDGRVQATFTYGLARRETRAPVTERTVFRCASVSKLVLAMGALRLCEQGLLTLDGDIGEIFGFPVRNPRFPNVPITLRQLLTHTAGLSDAGGYTRGQETLTQLLGKAENYLPHAPGAQFAYTNFGAGVAGCLMECAAGERLDTLMERLIFAPLGVKASFAPQRIERQAEIANGYHVRPLLPPRLSYDAQALACAPLMPADWQRDYFIAPGRMLAASGELAQLLALLLSSDGQGILAPESLAEMRCLQDGRGSVTSAGRGLNVAFLEDLFRPGRLCGHQGVAYGMCCELWGDPQTGDGVVFQTNGARLSHGGSLMHVGADAITLGFAMLQQ